MAKLLSYHMAKLFFTEILFKKVLESGFAFFSCFTKQFSEENDTANPQLQFVAGQKLLSLDHKLVRHWSEWWSRYRVEREVKTSYLFEIPIWTVVKCSQLFWICSKHLCLSIPNMFVSMKPVHWPPMLGLFLLKNTFLFVVLFVNMFSYLTSGRPAKNTTVRWPFNCLVTDVA